MTTMTTSAANRRSVLPNRLRRCAAIAAICGGLVGLSGCDSQTESDRILAQAGDVVNAINIQGAMPAPSIKRRADELRGLVTKLKPVADAKDPATAAAAQSMLARAYGGLGELAAKAAADEERQFLNQINVVRAKLDQWISQHAVAAALNIYDPTKDLAELDAQIAARGEDVTKLGGDLTRQEAKVAQIRAQAQALKAESAKVRAQEAAVRARGENVSQTARAEIIREAVEVSRRADALELQAGETEALADKEAPVATEIKSQIERVNRQKESLQKAKQDIQERADAARKQSAEATAEANKVGGEIATVLTALSAKREAADGPTQESIKQFTLAATTAKAAGVGGAGEANGAASASSGTFQQSLGDAHATRARSLAAHAALLDALANAKPALPNASELATKAQKARDEAKAARESAITAYKAAKSAYEGAKTKGDLKARYEALGKALEELEKEPVAVKATAAPTTEGASVIEGEIRAAIDAAGNDPAAFAAFFVPKGELAEKLFTAGNKSTASIKALDEALKSKFGKTLHEIVESSTDEAVKSDPILKQVGDTAALKHQIGMLAPKSAKISVKSESEATLIGMMSESKLVKHDGKWTMEVELPAAMTPMLEPTAIAMKKFNDGIDEIATKVTAGSIASGDDAAKAVGALAKAAMEGMMPGGGGKP